MTAGATFSDDPEHDAIDLANRTKVATVPGCRQTIVENPFERGLRREGLGYAREHFADVIRVIRNVGVEECLDDDPQRQSVHVTRQISSFAGLPTGDGVLG